MNKHFWFSTCLRIALIIEGEGVVRYMDSVYVLKIQNDDFEKADAEAFKRALEIGYSLEKEYQNIDKKRVQWKFKEVISLDSLFERKDIDGAEVYCHWTELENGEAVPSDEDFHPEKSKPGTTI